MNRVRAQTHGKAVALATLVVAVGALACNAVLGNGDGVYAPEEAGTGVDARPQADGEALDAAIETSKDACSVDLRTDDHNCGRCGHDCFGGGCDAGMCQPTTLAAQKNAPLGIAIDDVAVYFTTIGGFDAGASDASPFLDDTVERCTLPSCAAAQVLASNQAYPASLAVVAGVVYWTNTLSATVSSCARDGCGGAPTVMTASAGASAWDLTGDATGIYWTNEGGDVRACSTSTCGSFPTLIRSGATPIGIARGMGSLLFWTERGTGPNFIDGVVSRGQITPAASTPLASGLQSVNGIAADATHVYFVTSGDGSVWKCPHATGCTGANASSLVLLANAQNTPWRVAVDASDVYWTNKGDGSVMRCAIAGCANKPTLVATGKTGAWGIALDRRFVYWTATGTVGARDGAVMKVAK